MYREEYIETNLNGEKVKGFLTLPESKGKHPLVILVHGWSSNHLSNRRLFVNFARELADNDFAAVRFDFRGSGDSDGKFENQNHTRMQQDLEKVIEKLAEKPEIEDDRITLIGHSQGGYNSILRASEDDRIKALISWMGRTSDIEDYTGKPWKKEIERSGSYHVNGYPMNQQYLEDSKNFKSEESIKKLEIPIGLIYGNADITVPPSEGKRVKNLAETEVEMKIYDGLDHNFSGEESREKVKKQTINWLERWLK